MAKLLLVLCILSSICFVAYESGCHAKSALLGQEIRNQRLLTIE